jgi:hypothetical protein
VLGLEKPGNTQNHFSLVSWIRTGGHLATSTSQTSRKNGKEAKLILYVFHARFSSILPIVVFVERQDQQIHGQIRPQLVRAIHRHFTIITTVGSRGLPQNSCLCSRSALVHSHSALNRLIHTFASVTDYDRKFVLGVATSQDLENFVTRRGS